MKLSKIWPNEDLNLDGIKRICGRIKRYGTQRVMFKTHDVTLDSTFFALFCKRELPPDLKQVLTLKCVPPWLLFFHILGSVVKVMSLPHSVSGNNARSQYISQINQPKCLLNVKLSSRYTFYTQFTGIDFDAAWQKSARFCRAQKQALTSSEK